MNRVAPLALGLAIALLASPGAEAQYQLIFDPSTGSLTIDTSGDPLITYVILGDTNALPGGFLQENHTQIPGNPNAFDFISDDDELSDSNLSIWNGLGPTSLGNVLPIGLSQADFEAFITEANYVAEFGTSAGPASKFNFNIVYVPEPTSLVLLALGGALLAKRRRK